MSRHYVISIATGGTFTDGVAIDDQGNMWSARSFTTYDEFSNGVLNVIDSSKSGLAMLITQKDSDLLEILDEGDKIRDMSFFGIGARIKDDGTVKHMTKVKEGKFKGCYVLGVEAPDL